MALCEYCGESAGWFSSSHPACVAKADSTGQTVKDLVFDGILAGKPYEELSAAVQDALTDNKVLFKHVREALLQGVNDALSQLALQAPVSEDEFERLVAISGSEGFDMMSYGAGIVSRRWFSVAQLTMSVVLWQVLHNRSPWFEGSVDFNLGSNEIPVYQSGDNVIYAEERTVSTHVRSFGGLSVPIGGGVYYHFGGSQGHQERTSGLVQLDGGKMLITSQALYFGGRQTTFRIALDRVLSYQPYVDGVGVCESHGAPKVFVFDYSGMDAGWFFYNVLSALTRNLTQED
jgi:hypothetical protein